MAFPTDLSSFTTRNNSVDVIYAEHINDIQTAIENIEATIGITTDRPKFLAYNSATDADVTGDGTTATVDFDTEVFDTGADFASDVFTAPRTGKYLLIANVTIAEAGASHTAGELYIVTSNRTYQSWSVPYSAVGGSYGTWIVVAVADMDAGDTAYVTYEVSGSTKIIDILGSGFVRTYFAGAWLGE